MTQTERSEALQCAVDGGRTMQVEAWHVMALLEMAMEAGEETERDTV